MNKIVEDVQYSFMIKFSITYTWEFAQVDKWCLQKHTSNNKILFSSNIRNNEECLYSPLKSVYCNQYNEAKKTSKLFNI